MGDKSKIEWTDATWNPVRGCSRVSEGCRHCYAEGIAARFSGPGQPYEGLAVMKSDGPHWTGEVRLIEKHLEDPLHWKKPRRIFVNSMSDLFHEKVPDEWLDQIFHVMEIASLRHHTFQVLTKRPQRMLRYCGDPDTASRLRNLTIASLGRPGIPLSPGSRKMISEHWPLENVWLGVSVEDQKTADERIPILLQTPAAVRWVSYEPALGSVNLADLISIPDGDRECSICGLSEAPERDTIWRTGHECPPGFGNRRMDWLVCGGESGPGARPMHSSWARSVRKQCVAAGIPFFFKQGSQANWPLFKDFASFPKDLQIREYPDTT